jgi:hypothetical protein
LPAFKVGWRWVQDSAQVCTWCAQVLAGQAGIKADVSRHQCASSLVEGVFMPQAHAPWQSGRKIMALKVRDIDVADMSTAASAGCSPAKRYYWSTAM